MVGVGVTQGRSSYLPEIPLEVWLALSLSPPIGLAMILSGWNSSASHRLQKIGLVVFGREITPEL